MRIGGFVHGKEGSVEKSEQMVSLTTEMRGIVEKTGHERVCEEGKRKRKRE